MNWVELAAPMEPSACSNHQSINKLDAKDPWRRLEPFFRHFECDEIPVEPLRYDCTPGSTPNAGKISPGPFQNYRPEIARLSVSISHRARPPEIERQFGAQTNCSQQPPPIQAQNPSLTSHWRNARSDYHNPSLLVMFNEAVGE